MIERLRGKLLEKSATDAIIDCNGVCYQVFISVKCSDKLPEINSEITIFTILIPREDAHNLYGFYNKSERDFFKLLITVSGIGPKSALGTLSSMDPEDMARAISNSDLTLLQKLPGVGKKTAERIIVELKDKMSKLSLDKSAPSQSASSIIEDETIAALITLGYPKATADKIVKLAVKSLGIDNLTVEKLIKMSLKLAN